MKEARAKVAAGAWKLPYNDVWNVPSDQNEVRFDMETSGVGWNHLIRVEGLAITLDGRVFGKRRLADFREAGYHLEGRVSVGGQKYRAFTSSKLFEREDGSLCDVAVLVVCDYWPIECKYRRRKRALEETGKPEPYHPIDTDPAPGVLGHPCWQCEACEDFMRMAW